MPLFNPPIITLFATAAALQAANIPRVVNSVQLTGYTSNGDFGGGTYIRVGAQPAYPGYIQSNDGAYWQLAATDVTAQQFGAVAGGPNCSPAIADAYSYLSNKGGGKLIVVGTLYIQAPINPAKHCSLTGYGFTSDGNTYPRGTIRKAADVVAITVANDDVVIECLNIDGQKAIAATTDGIQIWGSRSTIRYLSVYNCGRDNVRYGRDAGSPVFNANLWTAYCIHSDGATRHGYYFNDGTKVDADVNAGKADMLSAANCGGDGIKIDNAWDNSFDQPVLQVNAGIGVNIVGNALNNAFIKVYTENNTTSEAYAAATTSGNVVWFDRCKTNAPKWTDDGNNNFYSTSDNTADIYAMDKQYAIKNFRANGKAELVAFAGVNEILAARFGATDQAVGSGGRAYVQVKRPGNTTAEAISWSDRLTTKSLSGEARTVDYYQPGNDFTYEIRINDVTGVNFSGVILEPAATIPNGTIRFIPGEDGQVYTISSTEIVTALAVTVSGGVTVKNPPTTLAAGQVVSYIYRAANTTWYRQ